MKKKRHSKKLYLYILLFLVVFLNVNIVYAATSSKLQFCDYSGVRRTFMIIGIIINMVKIIVPIILMASAMVAFFKTITTGKTEDFKASLLQVVKQTVAGLVVFCLPGLIDYAFSLVDSYDTTGFRACSTCLLDASHCTIPDKDPEIYDD